MYRILIFVAFAAAVAWLATEPSFEPFIAVLVTVGALLRDEIHGIVGFKRISLTPRRGLIKDLSKTRYSFVQPEYVNPMIIADLIGWLSDTEDQVVAVDVIGSNSSNRYFAESISARSAEPSTIVTAVNGESSFSYQYLGRSVTGIHLLRTWHSGGGSGVFCDITLLTVSAQPALKVSEEKVDRTDRLAIQKLTTIPLGDRYNGEIRFRFGILSIGPCKGSATLRKSVQHLLVV